MFDAETMKRLAGVLVDAVHEREIRGFYVAFDSNQQAITVSLVCHCGQVFSATGDELEAFETASELFNDHQAPEPKKEEMN